VKIVVVLNGVSWKKTLFYRQILPSLQSHFSVSVKETERAGHAEELASGALTDAPDFLLAAGGDGTLNQVINGVMKAGTRALPTLGLIPLGSGNDFARSANVSVDPEQLISLLRANQPKLIDVGRAELLDEKGKPTVRFFINVCSIGMGPEVVQRIAREQNLLGPGFTYFKGIVTTFLSLKAVPIDVTCSEGWEWKGKARAFAIANGKSFGHAVYIAPDAELDDGVLNTFLATDFPMWRFLWYLQTIKGGKKVTDPNILYKIGKTFKVESSETLPVEAEGELIGFTPLNCTIDKQRIRFLCR
jgi:YegS/Rv2252/BmrU family lipid kinase